MTITLDDLRARARSYRAPTYDSASKAKVYGVRTAFLCHSHLDQELARGLVQWMANLGISVYIDWADQEMPSTPNRTTAERLKERILDADSFLFLATRHSMDSRWCPWEIGFADGKKGPDTIVMIPTSDDRETKGSEYLDLYRRLDTLPDGGLQIIPPGAYSGQRATARL